MSQNLERRMREICGSVEGRAGLFLWIPDTGERISVDGDRQFVSASTIKIPTLALLLEDAEQGRVKLEEKRPIPPENRVGGAGILQSLSPEAELSIRDYAELMMVLSDNIATNQIIDVVGMERVTGFCRRQGLKHTSMARKMMTQGALLPDGTRAQNYTSADDLGVLMEKIMNYELVSRAASDTMMRIMAGQRKGKFRDALPNVCTRHDPRRPLDPPAEGEVLVISKGGSLSRPKVMHDAAIFVLPNGRKAVLTMCTETRDRDRVMGPIREAARVLYDYLK